MQIRRHVIEDFWHEQTSNVSAGRTIAPRYLVMHYTTGWNGVASRDWLLGKHGNSGSSAHLVIDVDGTAWQICPFNRRAWHAGPSVHQGLRDLNSHAIGIEFVNPGWLRPDGRDAWVDFFGNRRTTTQLEEFGGFLIARHARVGGEAYAWPLFAQVQIERGLAITALLVAHYPVEAILSHEQIDERGWKTDPGPAFPMDAFTARLGERGDGPAGDWRVSATRLNLRGGPGTAHERIDPPGSLGRGVVVRRLRAEREWWFVEVVTGSDGGGGNLEGLTGWVHSDYLEQAT